MMRRPSNDNTSSVINTSYVEPRNFTAYNRAQQFSAFETQLAVKTAQTLIEVESLQLAKGPYLSAASTCSLLRASAYTT